jgi:hypothetical protein
MIRQTYLYPNYARGDRYLHQICKRAHRFTHRWRITRDPYTPGLKITYGYLGNIARHCKCESPSQSIDHILIADHSFVPSQLKHHTYRLGIHQDRIRTLNLGNAQLLDSTSRNTVHRYLKELQEQQTLSLFGVLSSDPASSQHAIAIKASPVLVALANREAENHLNSAMARFSEHSSSEGLSIAHSHKRTDISLCPDGERSKTINQGERFTINAKQISRAFCPTSMLALHLILHGIPVELSQIHPLADILGIAINKQTRSEALDLVYNAIVQTTFHVKHLRELEPALAGFNPAHTTPNRQPQLAGD